MQLESKPLNNVALSRVVLNFVDKCNLDCRFCYIPFKRVAAKRELCLRIVERCVDLGCRVITFGGGDPFMHSFILDLAAYAKERNVFVHVDTNGMALRKSNYALLDRVIDLIGLPLDGADRVTHGLMRDSPLSFDIAWKHLQALRDYQVKIKINTVLARQNLDTIEQLGRLLAPERVQTWSIYQFWPFSGVTRDDSSFIISNDEYWNRIYKVQQLELPFRVEPGPVSQRSSKYFFVGHDGITYASSATSTSDYEFLGSIFDEDIVDKWSASGHESLRDATRIRYIGKLGPNES